MLNYRILIIITSLLAILCGCSHSSTNTPPLHWAEISNENLAGIIAQSQQSVFTIQKQGQEGQTLATGFFVRPDGLAVTSYFETDTVWKLEAISNNGENHSIASVILQRPELGYSIIRIGNKRLANFDNIGKSLDQIEPAQPVVVLNISNELGGIWTKGIVRAIMDQNELTNGVLQIDAGTDLIPGSPVLDHKGRFVGVVSDKTYGCENCQIAISHFALPLDDGGAVSLLSN